MDNSDAQLVIRDTPFALWLFGIVFAGLGGFFFLQAGLERGSFLILFVVIGLSMLLFSSVLTITADRVTRTLRLDYRSLLRHNVKEIPFDEIAGIRVERSFSRGRHGSSSTYRVVLARKDGQDIPFRSYSSSGSGSKEEQATRLRAFIGVPGVDGTPAATLQAVQQMAQGAFQARQQALTGPEGEMRETGGVHWQLQSAAMGATPVTRWFSPDARTSGGFLFIAQKVDGQSTGGGLLAALSGTLFRQSLAVYGFQPGDTPGLEQATAVAPLDPSLEPHFMAFSSSPAAVHEILNPWAVMPLADWARRYPLRQFQSGARFSQLVVLFSPNGLYLATMNTLQPDQVEELTSLGVDLVKTQPGSGGGSSAF
jgi:hypothetical protein